MSDEYSYSYLHAHGMMDCIHLHACRRMQAHFAKYGKPKAAGVKYIARGCDANCSAYQVAVRHEVVKLKDALRTAWEGAEYMRGGCCDVRDAIAARDFATFYAYEIINGDKCFDKEYKEPEVEE